MSDPTSTYRVQLHAGFTLDDAAALAGYLADLGVSHLYCSPYLQAAPGSTHGYDGTDPSRVWEEIGGEEGRDRLVAALAEHGLGHVLDIVPNHLSTASPWFRDVLAHGPDSAYAAHFDVDWSRGRIALPVLDEGSPARIEVVGGELAYGDPRFPIAPGTGGGTPDEVHARQRYELVDWHLGPGYRRFFDVDALAGVRVEDEKVFADVHARVLGWLAEGSLDGLRVDHVDGLADPGGYLRRLRDAAPRAWVVVEKILQPGEALPPWPVEGATGYDAMREVGGLFVDPAGEAPLDALYEEIAGPRPAWSDVVHDGKLRAATTLLAAELRRLAALLPGVPRADEAIAELTACLPVYRTYLPGHGGDVLRRAVAEASCRRPDLPLGEVHAALLAGGELLTRFQQTSGMVMAKGVEDTAFYRYARFVALNEVGGDPSRFGVGLAEFHAACAARQRDRPLGMTALSTHDTKRSEDVRARLAVLSEIPGEWAAFARPRARDPMEYLLLQTFVGAAPLSDERALAYALKAAREAKERTSWTDPDPGYEESLSVWAVDVLPACAEFATGIAPHGRVNSLAQKLVQLTMPGVPDVYQGCEFEDLSLVDPDNRRPVEWRGRDGDKPRMTRAALRLRRERPTAFRGAYRPLEATTDHLVAFARGEQVVTLAPRLVVNLDWAGATVTLPSDEWRDVLTGTTTPGGERPVADLLARFPVALLAKN